MIRRGLGALPLVLLLGAPPVAAGGPPTPTPSASVRVNDAAVRNAMQDELARSMADLRLGDEPRPYYLAYTISDLDQATVNATLGAVTSAHGYHGRVLRTDVRVGDPSFDNTNFEGDAHVDTIPFEDDYAAIRRELWLRTDEAYKSALETLSRKRAAAAGQAGLGDDEPAVGDFSKEAPAHLEVPFPAGSAEPEALRDTARQLSALLLEFPEIQTSRVAASYAIVRRRFISSEGSFVDDFQRTTRIDVIAETQAPDGMKLREFVPFTALTPGGLPPVPQMEKAVRAMAKELVAMRSAPVAATGAGAVLFEGLAAPQLVKRLLGDQIAGTPPPRTTQAGSDDDDQSALAGKLGQKVASPILSAADDPLLAAGPGGAALFGAYKIDDEGVPAQRVSIIEHGVLKSLLMSRTPRREIAHSNGHARAPRFASPRARVGALVVSGARPLPRPALLDELGKIAKSGGVTTYVVRLLDEDTLPGTEGDDLTALLSFGLGSHGPPPIRPLVAYRLDHGKETLVRGLMLENMLPRSLKDITAIGGDVTVDNYLDGGSGFSGVPTTIVSPPLLVSDVDIRRQTGRNRKPPLYPSPLARP
jgi:TldD protein